MEFVDKIPLNVAGIVILLGGFYFGLAGFENPKKFFRELVATLSTWSVLSTVLIGVSGLIFLFGVGYSHNFTGITQVFVISGCTAFLVSTVLVAIFPYTRGYN